MTNAGLDPSRIQERAEMLAKVQGAKRKRNADDEDEDVEMDDDDDDFGSASEKDMDVDDYDEESSPAKRVKTNSGGVINKRAPRSNRQAAGMRDEGVSEVSWLPLYGNLVVFIFIFFIAIYSCNQASQSWSTSSQYACESRRRRSCYQNQNGKISSHKYCFFSCYIPLSPLPFSRNIYSLASAKAERRKEDDLYLYFFCEFFFTRCIFFFIGNIYLAKNLNTIASPSSRQTSIQVE